MNVAAKYCRLAATRFLLQAGADINAKGGRRGHTPLYWASKEANETNKHADTYRTVFGIDRAECKAVVDLLRKHGAKE